MEVNDDILKRAVKEALKETLHEERGLLHEVLAEAMREGRQTDLVECGEVFGIFGGKP